ncbi:hypothetical protein [Streptomyces massasporeus]|uniref:hypothetical protein n=1 Tax=Streptomyces massasporeus TaxID=67324 RepID=UPI00167AC6E0|nr:hypothetical protein [Streptomyces massasporeus]GGV91618.1 hypothetical protein GCM10010228_82450 [Streptomyces massasporeus]
MRTRITLGTMLAAALLTVAAPAAQAADAGSGSEARPTARSCGELRLTGSLPVPPAGMAVEREVSIGADCTARFGAVRLVQAEKAEAATAQAASAVAPVTDGTHRVSGWNEMYDCCNIRMTGLYTASEWTTGGGRVTGASTEATRQWNREPWNAGWSLTAARSDTDCTSDCAVSRTEAHADFGYRGIFDVTGSWYANTHHSYVDLAADGTASCRFDVELRHTFVGWNWRHGCA